MSEEIEAFFDESSELQQEYSLGKGLITKVKFRKALPTITKLEKEGFNQRVIWAYLKKHQLFDCSYAHFGRLFREWKRSSMEKPNATESASETVRTPQQSNAGKSKTFDFSPTPNKDELI